jgi:hypothetical protein
MFPAFVKHFTTFGWTVFYIFPICRSISIFAVPTVLEGGSV